MGNEQIERWYSMKEISEYLGITRDTALSWIEKRGMPGVKVGRTWKFKISEVDAWMRSGKTEEKIKSVLWDINNDRIMMALSNRALIIEKE